MNDRVSFRTKQVKKVTQVTQVLIIMDETTRQEVSFSFDRIYPFDEVVALFELSDGDYKEAILEQLSGPEEKGYREFLEIHKPIAPRNAKQKEK